MNTTGVRPDVFACLISSSVSAGIVDVASFTAPLQPVHARSDWGSSPDRATASPRSHHPVGVTPAWRRLTYSWVRRDRVSAAATSSAKKPASGSSGVEPVAASAPLVFLLAELFA